MGLSVIVFVRWGSFVVIGMSFSMLEVLVGLSIVLFCDSLMVFDMRRSMVCMGLFLMVRVLFVLKLCFWDSCVISMRLGLGSLLSVGKLCNVSN